MTYLIIPRVDYIYLFLFRNRVIFDRSYIRTVYFNPKMDRVRKAGNGERRVVSVYLDNAIYRSSRNRRLEMGLGCLSGLRQLGSRPSPYPFAKAVLIFVPASPARSGSSVLHVFELTDFEYGPEIKK